MQLFTLVAVAVYCGVSLVLGVRLLLLARRTGELPELLIGIAFLSGGMLGYPFTVAGGVLRASQPDLAQVATALGQVGMSGAAFFNLLVWRRIFAPELRWGGALTAVGLLALGGLVTAVILTAAPDAATRLMSPFYWLHLSAQAACYALCGVAGIRYSRMLERRLALGMADPVVANRMLLWGLSGVAITVSYLYSMAAGMRLAAGHSNIYHPAVIAGLGLFCAVLVTLSFLPPRAYLAHIRATHAPSGA